MWLIYKFSYYLIWTECNGDQMRGDIRLIVHLEQMLEYPKFTWISIAKLN